MDRAATEPAPVVVRPVYDWEAANERKIDAVRQLAPLNDALDDIEARVDELIARTKQLDWGGLDQLAPRQVRAVERRYRSNARPVEGWFAAVAVRPVCDWAANQRNKGAVHHLAPLADALDDIEARIAECVAKTDLHWRPAVTRRDWHGHWR